MKLMTDPPGIFIYERQKQSILQGDYRYVASSLICDLLRGQH